MRDWGAVGEPDWLVAGLTAVAVSAWGESPPASMAAIVSCSADRRDSRPGVLGEGPAAEYRLVREVRDVARITTSSDPASEALPVGLPPSLMMDLRRG